MISYITIHCHGSFGVTGGQVVLIIQLTRDKKYKKIRVDKKICLCMRAGDKKKCDHFLHAKISG